MKIQILDMECAPLEVRAGDAGIDLRSRVVYSLKPYCDSPIRVGIKVAIPEGHMGLIAPRSGLGTIGVKLKNDVGIIDANYRGEIIVHLINESTKPFNIRKGHRIAQMVIVPIYNPIFEIVESLDETNRGADGFGSSGV